ncbi:PREDICTED: scavenger receptor class B member 1-like isoform X4 [Atta colombica]|uniref:scavenger receptor class B member 1-like isoform X4 n=1 Tax=Atta colombica TaxID=520822 RepID=UPI00084C199F|nr:PREDICTED: scavenger receptor class B member 1-like isoform X4 [Atta colombica]
MKDIRMIWNTLSRCQIYSSVNINPNIEKQVEQDETRTLENLQRKSSVMLNKFFNTALPVDSNSRQNWSKNIFMFIILSLLGLASGCFILLCDPYELLFRWKIVFSDGGEIFEYWRKPVVDLYVKIYLFNVTNHNEYLSGEASKLRFQEIGPYVYKETFEHANVVFNDNGTLSTIPVHPLKYIPEMSNGTEEDLVIMPNIALFMYDFDGDFETIYTGETDVRTIGLIDKYNGDVNLPQWTGKCANVQGASDGVKFPSYIEPNDTILFFRKSLCRSARLVRIGEKTLQGLETYKYTFMENELDNGAVNPENKCFCRKGFCLKPGLIDVTDCYYGFPIALSYPHFYKSDPSFLEAIEGLEPNKELHESYFYIQPKSGTPINLASRFQINMVLQNIGHMARVEKFPHMTIPLLWFEIGMYKLPLNLNLRFWFYLNFMPVLAEVSMYLLFLSGTVLLVWCIMRILFHQTKKSSEWLEMKRKQRKAHTDKQIDPKVKDIDVFSTLLTSGDPNLMMV